MKKKKLHRRELLKGIASFGAVGVSGIPYSLFSDFYLRGLFQKAYAQTSNVNPRRYIFIHNPGAPARWCFDLILDKSNNPNFLRSGISNQFEQKNGKVSAVYKEITFKGGNNQSFGIPPLWNTVVNTPSSGNQKLSHLLENALVVRGVDTLTPGHLKSSIRTQESAPGSATLGGLVADGLNFKIPGIAMGAPSSFASFPFTSNKNKSAVYSQASKAQLTEGVMGAFNNMANTNFNRLDQTNETALLDLASSISEKEMNHFVGSNSIEEIKAAKDLMKSEYDKFTVEWPNLINKYQEIIDKILTPDFVIQGVSDFPLTNISGDKKSQLRGVIPENEDLRTVIHKKLDIAGLSEQFAMTEYMMVNNLSSTIRINTGHLNSLKLQKKNALPETIDEETGETIENFEYIDQLQGYRSDEHDVGSYLSIIANSYFYSALGACMTELVSKLKSTALSNGLNLFDETVIQLSGEFNRSPRGDESGSDHGFKAASTLLLSGAISGLQVIGDLVDQPPGSTKVRNPGTWGYGANMPFLNNTPIQYGNLISSVSTALRIESPAPFRSSLLTEENGKIKAASNSIRRGKIKVVS